MIEVSNVEKYFGQNHVLRDCSLRVDEGEIVTLLGASGCGKTTLLRCIAGFEKPRSGRILLAGRDVTRLPPNRRDVGFVFQNYALFPHMTVGENVAYGMSVRGVARAEIARRVKTALDGVSLSALDGRYPKSLSGGQQQRVALARSMVLDPQVLLMDEAFNALDAKLRGAMQVELRKIVKTRRHYGDLRYPRPVGSADDFRPHRRDGRGAYRTVCFALRDLRPADDRIRGGLYRGRQRAAGRAGAALGLHGRRAARRRRAGGTSRKPFRQPGGGRRRRARSVCPPHRAVHRIRDRHPRGPHAAGAGRSSRSRPAGGRHARFGRHPQPGELSADRGARSRARHAAARRAVSEALAKFRQGKGVWPVVPAFVFLGLFFILPMTVLLSFGFWDIERGEILDTGFTTDHFQRVLTDDLFWRVWWKSFYVGTIATAICLLLAYPVAYVYSIAPRFWRLIILILTISPLLTSAVVRTYAWLVILGGRRGVVNAVLTDLGLIERPLRMLNSDFAVITGMIQVHLPFMILPLITVLAGRDRNLELSSLGLGASRVATFLRVVLPMSVPGIVAGVTIVFALSYTNFIVPQLLGGGGYTTLAVQVYESIVVVLDWSKGAALALLLLGSCFVFILLIGLFGNRAMRWLEPNR